MKTYIVPEIRIAKFTDTTETSGTIYASMATPTIAPEISTIEGVQRSVQANIDFHNAVKFR